MIKLLRLAPAALAACIVSPALAAQQADRPEYIQPRVYSAAEAVAAAAGGRGVPGIFAFVVRGAGRDATRVFLNSEADYRSPSALTVAVSAEVAAAIAEQQGGRSEQSLLGRTIVVHGLARQVRIDILERGQPNGLFYVQTHVPVTDPTKIHIVPGNPAPISVDPSPR